MRLALALAAVVALAGAARADTARCMAMANNRTAALSGNSTMSDGEAFQATTIERTARGLAICAGNHTCWPAADLDLVTPCTPEAMQSSVVKLR